MLGVKNTLNLLVFLEDIFGEFKAHDEANSHKENTDQYDAQAKDVCGNGLAARARLNVCSFLQSPWAGCFMRGPSSVRLLVSS